MNERIKQLELEAIAYADSKVPVNDRYNDIYHSIVRGKFAELIVQECIKCCEQVISDPVPKSVDTFEQGGIHCMDEIKQHFGVGMSTEDKKTLIKELLGVKNDFRNFE
jgi:hypothetical protein